MKKPLLFSRQFTWTFSQLPPKSALFLIELFSTISENCKSSSNQPQLLLFQHLFPVCSFACKIIIWKLNRIIADLWKYPGEASRGGGIEGMKKDRKNCPVHFTNAMLMMVKICLLICLPHAGSGAVRIDLLCFRARCCKRRLNQTLYNFLLVWFWLCCLLRPLFMYC